MIHHTRLEHRFVHHIPESLEPGILYVSMDYATAVHSCCCGCGSEVVTPFTPTDWKMTFDGQTISLAPSIGNWKIRCRSHYVVNRSDVIDAGPWTDEEIATELLRDKLAKAAYYRPGAQKGVDETASTSPTPTEAPPGVWSRIITWLKL